MVGSPARPLSGVQATPHLPAVAAATAATAAAAAAIVNRKAVEVQGVLGRRPLEAMARLGLQVGKSGGGGRGCRWGLGLWWRCGCGFQGIVGAPVWVRVGV